MEEFIEIDNTWLERAKQYGTERDAQNGGNDTAAYRHNGPLPYSSLTASRLAVVGEVAAHLYFGVDPSTTTYVFKREDYARAGIKNNADLTVNGRKVEVRNATNPSRPIPIKEKDVKANAIVVQVYVEMETLASGGKKPTGKVYFLGWADAPVDYNKTSNKRNGTAYKAYKRPMSDLSGVLV